MTHLQKENLMASSEGMSNHNNALLRKFKGNGWELTYSAKSQKQVSAMLGDKLSAAQQPKTTAKPNPPRPASLQIIQYKRDWADTLIDRSFTWMPEEDTAPLWLEKGTEGSDFALFQLPAPDDRWVVKHAGKILEPFTNRLEGWPELHELMSHGHLLDRTTFAQPSNILRAAELIRTVYERDNETASEALYYSATGARLIAPDNTGKGEHDYWKTCADDASKQLRDRLDRVLNAIKRKSKWAAAGIKKAIYFKDGQFLFKDSGKWMTALDEIPHDATMILRGEKWEVNFPDCGETLIIPDGVAIRAIARLLMCHNSACPSALLSNGELLNEFLGRPRHHKYFDAIHRNPKVECGNASNNEVERAVCEAMRYKEGWSYRADHVISEGSELHTVCQLPTALVTLRRADALEGIVTLLKQQQAKLFFCRPPSPQFSQILSDIEAGVKFARKQENLLQQVQPKSEDVTPNIQKAIHRLQSALRDMGDWTTRYDVLADHFAEYIRGGIVFQYTGPYRWKIGGLSQTPDVMDLAEDHTAYKRRKIARARRKAKLAFEAIRVPNPFAQGAAAGR
jgi:hypothetical protein